MDNEKKPINVNLLEKDLLLAPAGTGKPFPIEDELIKICRLLKKKV